MSSEDYLVRYFMQLGNVLASILGYRKRKEYSLAIDEIDQTLTSWFNVGADSNSVDESFIKEMLSHPSHRYEAEKSLAELLYQKAITLNLMGQIEESSKYASLALLLIREIDKQSGEFSIESQLRITELSQLIPK